MRIDRCICFNTTFARLKEVMQETGATSVEELQEHVQFGLNCRLCHPYVKNMLKTGVTTFDRVLLDNSEQG